MPNRDTPHGQAHQAELLDQTQTKVEKYSKLSTCQIESKGFKTQNMPNRDIEKSTPTVNKKFQFISCICLKMQKFPSMKLRMFQNINCKEFQI